mgnify:CR=1 FL=1
MLDMGWLTSLALAGIGAVVEVVRLEGRLNSHDLLFTERAKAVELLAELSASRHAELNAHLIRIERKLDDSLRRTDGPTAR